MIRVNKAAAKLLALVAKSRLIVSGHLDPELGSYRTDSQTVALTTRLIKTLAASRKYAAYSFDASTAFLSGKKTEWEIHREVFLRWDEAAVKSLELLEAVSTCVLSRSHGWHLGSGDDPNLSAVEILPLPNLCGTDVLLACGLRQVVDGYSMVAVDCGMRFLRPASRSDFQFNPALVVLELGHWTR